MVAFDVKLMSINFLLQAYFLPKNSFAEKRWNTARVLQRGVHAGIWLIWFLNVSVVELQRLFVERQVPEKAVALHFIGLLKFFPLFLRPVVVIFLYHFDLIQLGLLNFVTAAIAFLNYVD